MNYGKLSLCTLCFLFTLLLRGETETRKPLSSADFTRRAFDNTVAVWAAKRRPMRNSESYAEGYGSHVNALTLPQELEVEGRVSEETVEFWVSVMPTEMQMETEMIWCADV